MYFVSRCKKFAVRTLCLVCVSGTVFATPLKILQDNGGTPVEAVIESITGVPKPDIVGAMKAEREAIKRGDYSRENIVNSLKRVFPLESALPERKVENRDFVTPKTEITRPIALLGQGVRSQQWVKKQGARLKELNTYVAVIDARSQAVVDYYVKQLKMPVEAVQLDEFAARYGVTALPVIITANGVYQ